jgi:hypothetical protein
MSIRFDRPSRLESQFVRQAERPEKRVGVEEEPHRAASKRSARSSSTASKSGLTRRLEADQAGDRPAGSGDHDVLAGDRSIDEP